jgi:hypothetical protein
MPRDNDPSWVVFPHVIPLFNAAKKVLLPGQNCENGTAIDLFGLAQGKIMSASPQPQLKLLVDPPPSRLCCLALSNGWSQTPNAGIRFFRRMARPRFL